MVNIRSLWAKMDEPIALTKHCEWDTPCLAPGKPLLLQHTSLHRVSFCWHFCSEVFGHKSVSGKAQFLASRFLSASLFYSRVFDHFIVFVNVCFWVQQLDSENEKLKQNAASEQFQHKQCPQTPEQSHHNVFYAKGDKKKWKTQSCEQNKAIFVTQLLQWKTIFGSSDRACSVLKHQKRNNWSYV